MYCSSCGVVVAQGLSYCNYCGARLTGVLSEDVITSSEVKPETLVASMVALFIFGQVAIIMLMGVMKVILHLDLPLILAFTLLSYLIMIVIEAVFIRLLLRRRHGVKEASDTLLKGQATKELDTAQARVLPEPLQSVTDHTTRAFDPIYKERTSR